MKAPSESHVPWLTKVVYGSGDWGLATFNTLRQIFYAIFLTDVVGLDPRLASFSALFGVLWDAINDPLVGVISDRVRSKWGRRRPFLLYFAIPYGFAYLMLWWAPPWKSPWLVMLHMTLVYALSDTLQTLVIVPHHALTPAMTPDYDERTALTGYRMFFNLVASIVTAVAAPMIVKAALAAGATQQQGYVIVAALFGASAALPFLLIFFVVRETAAPEPAAREITFRETLRRAWDNIPFRYVTSLYMLNWVAFDLLCVMIPYFLIYWIAQGDQLATVPGLDMPLESVVLGEMLLSALITLPLWTWLARKLGKRIAYIIGMSFGTVILMGLFAIQPHQLDAVLALGVLAGFTAATAHVLPDAIFPDVIDWDELRTGSRQEGVYYGTKNFIRKLTSAFAIFLALQVLGWLGYRSPPPGATLVEQPASALWGIRLLTGPVPASLMVAAIVVAWFYPLDRRRYTRVQRLLNRRRSRPALLASNLERAPGGEG